MAWLLPAAVPACYDYAGTAPAGIRLTGRVSSAENGGNDGIERDSA